MSMESFLRRGTDEAAELMPKVAQLHPQLQKLGEAMLKCWEKGGKVLTAGNGGSACDAMHLAEELIARFQKNRRALAAIALCDPTVMTCAANDFGFESIFARQVEGLANAGDILVVFTTSGNSPNLIAAVEAAKAKGVTTVAFLGKDGGKLKGKCEIELHVPAKSSHRTQECHLVLYHTLCEWVDSKV
jgi:D-sedoheptulose 7-phosphate isomerase